MVTGPADGTGGERELVRRVGAAARAGVHLVQVRAPGLDGRALQQRVAACIAAAAGSSTRILVNDRLDVALATGAHGLHLRGDSMPANRVRPLAPRGFVIGRSVRTIAEARRADEDGGLDYLIFGTVFASRSKPTVAAAGLDTLAAVVAATRLPVLAIGGITTATAALLAATGAAGFAAIGLFARPDDRIGQVVAAASRSFDVSPAVT